MATSRTDMNMLKIYHNDPTPYPGPVNIELLMKAPYNAIWKEGKPFVRNEGGVDILVDTLGAIAPQPIVMVRSEYPQIFQHILDMPTWSETSAGLVVTGHPGVGKTLFLYYALGAALAAHMPVVLCDSHNLCVLFDYRGVRMIHDLRDADFAPRTLFLVDSNSSLHSPPGAFLEPCLKGVIVQATSPDPSRWESWAKEVGASSWVLGLWKREEILALQRVTEALRRPAWANPSPGTVEVYTPSEVFDLLGPCPRTCMRMAGRVKSQDGPQADFEAYLRLPALLSHLETVLRTVSSCQAPPDVYEHNDVYRFFFLYNARRSNPNDGPTFCYTVPTLFLHGMVCIALCSQPAASALRVATTYADAPSAAAAFYLPLALGLLLDARAGHACRVVDPQSRSSASFRIGPNFLSRVVPLYLDEAAVKSVDDNTVVFVPPTPDTPDSPDSAFHALVVSENKTRVTLLRMVPVAETPGPWPYARDSDPDLDLDRVREGIRSVVDAFSRVLPRPEEVRWSLVYVALRRGAAKKAAKSEEAREMLGDLRSRVGVGWLELRSRDRDTKALLNALEKKAQEMREIRDMWKPRGRVVHGLGNDTEDSSAGSLATQEKSMFRSLAAWAKTRHRSLLPCLNL